MLSLNASVDAQSHARVSNLFDGVDRDIRRQIRIAVSATMRHAESQMAKRITRDIKVLQRDVRAVIVRKLQNSGTEGEVVIKPTARIPLERFGARQVGRLRQRSGVKDQVKTGLRALNRAQSDARLGPRRKRTNAREVNPSAGVTYQISRSGGRVLLPTAFIVDRWRGAVRIRHADANGGNRVGRGPIATPQGVSPWGAYVTKDYLRMDAADATERLRQEIGKRIRFIELKRAGAI